MAKITLPTVYDFTVRLENDDEILHEESFKSDTLGKAAILYLENVEMLAQRIAEEKPVWLTILKPDAIGDRGTMAGSRQMDSSNFDEYYESQLIGLTHEFTLWWTFDFRLKFKRIGIEVPELSIDVFRAPLADRLSECIEAAKMIDKIIDDNYSVWSQAMIKKMRAEIAFDKKLERDQRKFGKEQRKAARKAEREQKRAMKRGEVIAQPDPRLAADADPLDPHGDGTLRPGDFLFDAMMSGQAVSGTRTPDGWDMKTHEVSTNERDKTVD